MVTNIDDIFPDTQFGVGKRAGVDRVIHVASAIIESLKVDCAVAVIDFTNAFNLRRRTDMMKSLLENRLTDPLWRLFHWQYAENSELLLFEPGGSLASTILSASGVRQGDPLAPLAFALSMKEVYAVAKQHDCQTLAYLDDLILIGTVENVASGFRAIQQKASEVGMEVNTSKSGLYVPNQHQADQQAATISKLRENMFELIPKFAPPTIMRVQLGDTENQAKAMLEVSTSEMSKYCEAIAHGDIPCQVFFPLLRFCGAPKSAHRFRTWSPLIAQRAAEATDDIVWNTFLNRIGAQGTSQQSEMTLLQIGLPRSLTGLGLGCQQRSRFAASLSSMCLAIKDIVVALPPDSNPNITIPKFLERIDFCQKNLSSNDASDVGQDFLRSPHDCWEHTLSLGAQGPPKNLQRNLAAPGNRAYLNRLEDLASEDTFHRQRIKTLRSSRTASRALFLIPSTNNYKISDGAFSTTALLHLGLNLMESSECAMCGLRQDQRVHPLLCHKIRRNEITHRHDAICQTTLRLAREECNVEGFSEPRPDWTRDGKRAERLKPDHSFAYGEASALGDVKITTPGNVSSGATEKRKKYRAMADQNGAKFFAEVMSYLGEMHQDYSDLLYAFGECRQNLGRGSEQVGFVQHAVDTLQACLARGNALCVAAARNAAAGRRVRAQPGHEFGPLLEVNDADTVREYHSSLNPNPLLASGAWW